MQATLFCRTAQLTRKRIGTLPVRGSFRNWRSQTPRPRSPEETTRRFAWFFANWSGKFRRLAGNRQHVRFADDQDLSLIDFNFRTGVL